MKIPFVIAAILMVSSFTLFGQEKPKNWPVESEISIANITHELTPAKEKISFNIFLKRKLNLSPKLNLLYGVGMYNLGEREKIRNNLVGNTVDIVSSRAVKNYYYLSFPLHLEVDIRKYTLQIGGYLNYNLWNSINSKATYSNETTLQTEYENPYENGDIVQFNVPMSIGLLRKVHILKQTFVLGVRGTYSLNHIHANSIREGHPYAAGLVIRKEW